MRFPLHLACALALLSLRTAAAQPSEPEPQADAEESEIEERVVFGVRPGVIRGEPSAFGDVLEMDDYTAENQNLADLLSEQAGIFVRRFGGAGDRSEVTIRGSTAQQVVVAIDGVPANSALTGGLDLSRVCLPLIGRVEIARGAGATRLGSGAVGGVVNLVTRDAQAEPETRISGSGGAFDTWQGSAFRAASTDWLDYQVGYCGLRTDGDFEFARPVFIGPDGVPSSPVPDHAERINNELTQHGATLGLGGELGPGRLRFSDFFVHGQGGEPGLDDGSPGPTAGQNPSADATNWTNLAQLRYETGALMPAHEGMKLGLYHRYEDNQYHDPQRALFGAPVDVRAAISTVGGSAESDWRGELGPIEQRASLGLYGLQDALSADTQSNRTRASGAFRIADEISAWEGRALLIPALRGEATEGFDFEWIPGVGAVLSPWDWLRLRANAGRAFRTPSFDELYHPDEGSIRGNPDLDAEEAWNFDAGFELLLAQLGPLADAQLVLDVFRREIDDSIVWVQVGPTTIEPINTGAATAQGVEVALQFRVTDYLRVALNYTELDSERDATGERLPGQPKRESFARVQLGPPDVWKLIGEWQYTGEILVSEGGERRLPDRDVWNASLSVNLAALPRSPLARWVPELWIFVEGNNLSDEAVRDSLAFPQPGRNLTAGFEAHW